MNTILRVENITKFYPGVIALSDVSLSFEKGEVHAIVGENGAGKSTLIKIISGAVSPSAGVININGREFSSVTPAQAIEQGISVIYQEFNLVESLSAAENVFLGRKGGRLVDFSVINSRSREIFNQFGLDISPETVVSKLTPAQMQIVEIAKSIDRHANVIIMDEPTAPLTTSETDKFFEIIKKLKDKGITVIYISHRLDEIFTIADRVSVLRDGCNVETLDVSETNRQELIGLMVGRSLNNLYPENTETAGEVILKVEDLSGNGLKNISFEVRKGEILGFGGLIGAGRTELMRMLFGADRAENGKIIYKGQEVHLKNPSDALRMGIGLIPEDRKRHGFVADQSIAWNATISNIKRLSTAGVVNLNLERKQAEELSQRLKIRSSGLDQAVRSLSGGNQQKVVLARALAVNSEVLIFDEPTRGIDVGARQEIYKLMVELISQGKAVIMVSSDMEELIGMSDRILVLSEGRISGEILKEDFSQEQVLELASL